MPQISQLWDLMGQTTRNVIRARTVHVCSIRKLVAPQVLGRRGAWQGLIDSTFRVVQANHLIRITGSPLPRCGRILSLRTFAPVPMRLFATKVGLRSPSLTAPWKSVLPWNPLPNFEFV